MPRGRRESGMCCVGLKNSPLWYHPAQAETSSVCYFLLRLTLTTGVQIQYSFCRIPGHTVRSEGGWWLTRTRDRHLESNLDAEIYLANAPHLSPLAPQFYWAVTDLARESMFFLIEASSVSWINVLTEEVNHARTLMICPSYTPMSTHLKNSLLYIFAFLKAWTML